MLMGHGNHLRVPYGTSWSQKFQVLKVRTKSSNGELIASNDKPPGSNWKCIQAEIQAQRMLLLTVTVNGFHFCLDQSRKQDFPVSNTVSWDEKLSKPENPVHERKEHGKTEGQPRGSAESRGRRDQRAGEPHAGKIKDKEKSSDESGEKKQKPVTNQQQRPQKDHKQQEKQQQQSQQRELRDKREQQQQPKQQQERQQAQEKQQQQQQQQQQSEHEHQQRQTGARGKGQKGRYEDIRQSLPPRLQKKQQQQRQQQQHRNNTESSHGHKSNSHKNNSPSIQTRETENRHEENPEFLNQSRQPTGEQAGRGKRGRNQQRQMEQRKDATRWTEGKHEGHENTPEMPSLNTSDPSVQNTGEVYVSAEYGYSGQATVQQQYPVYQVRPAVQQQLIQGQAVPSPMAPAQVGALPSLMKPNGALH